MKSAYPVQYQLVRLFTSGTLKGMTHTDTMGFASTKEAHDWRERVNENNKNGLVNYKVIKFDLILN